MFDAIVVQAAIDIKTFEWMSPIPVMRVGEAMEQFGPASGTR